jgi:hypothetical protein
MSDYRLDLDNPITDEERDAILGEIAAHPLGQAIRLQLLPASYEDDSFITLVVRRDQWTIGYVTRRTSDPLADSGKYYKHAPEFTTWHAVRRDLSDLCNVLHDVRQHLQEEGRGA